MKKKIRKVLGTAIVRNGYMRGSVDERYPDLPDGTEVELTALVKPKLMIVKPDGTAWKPSKVYPHRYQLLCQGSEIAVAYTWAIKKTVVWAIKEGDHCSAKDIEAAWQAAEEALADAGLYGFGWENQGL